jgi:hypothetical protein
MKSKSQKKKEHVERNPNSWAAFRKRLDQALAKRGESVMSFRQRMGASASAARKQKKDNKESEKPAER